MNEADQYALFVGDDHADRPAGLRYRPEFIAPDEEQRLVEAIKTLPLQPFQFGAYEGKRRVVSFGFHYDYSTKRLEAADQIPAWLRHPAAKVESLYNLAPGAIVHVLCTEYEVGVGIGWHRDKPHFDYVFGLSLAGSCRLRFRRKIGARWRRFTLDAQPRSLYLMTGDARHVWEHSIGRADALLDHLSHDGKVGAVCATAPLTSTIAQTLSGSNSMIHHLSLGSNDIVRARKFYDAVMPVLGLRLLKSNEGALHYGVGEIIFSLVRPLNGQRASPGNGTHVAFPVRTRRMVDDFHAQGLKNGGSSDGAPGLRPEYDANYYGAFLHDPDGNKVEAVTFAAK